MNDSILLSANKKYPLLALRSFILSTAIKWAIPVLVLFHKSKKWPFSIEDYRELKSNTLGFQISEKLDQQGFKMIPKYESHDLKHVLFNYGMTPCGEIRLQAFLVGNGSRSLSSVGVFVLGMILFPELWNILRKDFNQGKKYINMKSFEVSNLVEMPIYGLKETLKKSNYSKE